MGLIDMLLPKAEVAKATEALKTAELARRERIRRELLTSGAPADENLLDRLLVASSQAPSLLAAAEASGKGALAEILTKVAEKLSASGVQ